MHIARTTIVIAWGVAALLFSLAPAAAEKRVALVIGMSAYQHVARLENAGNDARLMAETLRGLGFTVVGNGPVLDRDKPGLENAIQDFGRQIQGADVALFYYSGHGMQVRGENYLIPVSANPMREADIDFNLVDVNVVLRQMEQAGTKLNMVILDACRNNPFAGRGFSALSRGLAQMDAPEGTIISYATAPGTVALDGDRGNSPFTKALAQTIQRPGLSVLDVFNDVGVAVMQATGSFQRPWLAVSPLKGRFYFAGEQQVAVVAPPIAPQKPSNPAPATGSRNIKGFALIIGISQFQDPSIGQLSYADNDAKEMFDVLSSFSTFPLDCIKILTNKEATGNAIRLAFRELDRRCSSRGEGSGNALIYFSGHGGMSVCCPTTSE